MYIHLWLWYALDELTLYSLEMSLFNFANTLCHEVYFIWYLTFWCILVEWYIRFYPLIFNLSVPLYLKYASCRQQIGSSYPFIHSSNLCFLVRVFNPFRDNIIINMGEFMSTILHVVFCCHSIFLFLCFSFPLFWVTLILMSFHFNLYVGWLLSNTSWHFGRVDLEIYYTSLTFHSQLRINILPLTVKSKNLQQYKLAYHPPFLYVVVVLCIISAYIIKLTMQCYKFFL